MRESLDTLVACERSMLLFFFSSSYFTLSPLTFSGRLEEGLSILAAC